MEAESEDDDDDDDDCKKGSMDEVCILSQQLDDVMCLRLCVPPMSCICLCVCV